MVPEVWSHRGLCGAPGWPAENTIDAFRAASELAVDGIELDVWRTASGEWRVQHGRGTPDGPIDTLSGIRTAGVPALGEALVACAVNTVNVELKIPDEMADAGAFSVGAELATFLEGEWPISRWTSRVVVSSFSPPAVLGVRSVATHRVETGLLILGSIELSVLAGIREDGHTAIHLEQEFITPTLVRESSANELKMVAWTVDDEERIRCLAEAGVDAIISNVPELVVHICRCPG